MVLIITSKGKRNKVEKSFSIRLHVLFFCIVLFDQWNKEIIIIIVQKEIVYLFLKKLVYMILIDLNCYIKIKKLKLKLILIIIN